MGPPLRPGRPIRLGHGRLFFEALDPGARNRALHRRLVPLREVELSRQRPARGAGRVAGVEFAKPLRGPMERATDPAGGEGPSAPHERVVGRRANLGRPLARVSDGGRLHVLQARGIVCDRLEFFGDAHVHPHARPDLDGDLVRELA